MAVKTPIYLDNHATTPLDPRVLEAMMPCFTTHFGNAASRNHSFGWTAEEAVEKGRAQVAALMHADPREIVFTSGATESDNLAIKGVAHMYREKGNHIITSVVEHKAVLDTCKRLEGEGFRVTYLPVDDTGMVRPESVAEAIEEGTILCSLMLANNEIGTINPIEEIGKLCRERGVLFHCDAVQGFGKIPFDVQSACVDLASVTSHKIYGPKGVGALYVRRRAPRVRLTPEMDGGGHEGGRRSGTLNVPGIVGFGRACELAGELMEEEGRRLTALREQMRERIQGAMEEVYLNGHPNRRLPGNLNLSFAYVEGEGLMMGMKDLAVSSGSACTSASLEPSYVLKALGVGDELAHSSIRYGLGRFTTEEETEYAT
ncbi:MAG: IscS subfamily cysteine desulfurase, partial [Armatimonadetes bacterium]|nr:IscS subfamily cysteine desulfurase [Armatimonadota bacterium]